MRGVIMASDRVNRPGIMVYGGSIKPGCSAKGDKLDLVSAFPSYGQYISGEIDDAQR